MAYLSLILTITVLLVLRVLFRLISKKSNRNDFNVGNEAAKILIKKSKELSKKKSKKLWKFFE